MRAHTRHGARRSVRLTADLDALPRPRLWGAWDGPTIGYVVAEVADPIAGNAVLRFAVDVEQPGRLVSWLLDRLDRRSR